MAEPLVSVVIPVYNVEPYLDRCVKSVADQSYSNLEIILVNDGSTDESPELCDAWSERDPRIRAIHQKNAGLGMARNAGMAAASGEYICFFDSDDYVDEMTIEKCVAGAEAHQADAVVFGRWDVPENSAPVKRPITAEKDVYQGQEIREGLLPGMFTYRFGFGVSACGKMYRLRTLLEHGIRFPSEREIISEDAWFALQFFSKAETVTLVPECLYYYVRRRASLSRQYLPHRQKKNDAFLEMSLECIRRNHLPEAVAVHLKVRYHAYTIAALKQTMAAQLTAQQKRKALWDIFNSPVLRGTLTKDVLAAEGKRTLRIFFRLLKHRCHGLCYLLLKLKMREQQERDDDRKGE